METRHTGSEDLIFCLLNWRVVYAILFVITYRKQILKRSNEVSMKKEVVITADSTCDLPSYLVKKHTIDLIPLGIQLGLESYQDGVDITPDDIYSYYNQTKVLPKTAAVSPGAYTDLFEKYTSQGKAVVHINLSSAISSTHQNALIAAKQFDDVYIVDSKSLCTGLGLLVLKACDLRDEGLSAQEVATRLETLKDKIICTFVLDTLEFLHKGGRCSGVARLGANILGLKPSIMVNNQDGTMSVGKKYRGKIDAVYQQYAKDIMKNIDQMDRRRIVVAHSGVSQDKIDIMRREVSLSGMFDEVIVARAGCTITSHCGPGTMAIIYMEN